MADSMTTHIQWTDETWNPTRGCSRVSPGCDHCYAIREARRKDVPGGSYEGLTRIGKRGLDWSGVVRLVPSKLDEPLRWRKPRRVFVNSMSDLFHEALSYRSIDRIVGRMAWFRRHTFQVLTKRPRRMRDYSAGLAALTREQRGVRMVQSAGFSVIQGSTAGGMDWPLPNVWLGTSVEDQATADERIPLLFQTPAAVRFISLEPQLAHVDLRAWLSPWCAGCQTCEFRRDHRLGPSLSWVIVGGESGPGARPFDLAWARSTVAQCKAAGVPVFVKQLGFNPRCGPDERNGSEVLPGGALQPVFQLRDRKGGSMEEWPEDLRVREFPA